MQQIVLICCTVYFLHYVFRHGKQKLYTCRNIFFKNFLKFVFLIREQAGKRKKDLFLSSRKKPPFPSFSDVPIKTGTCPERTKSGPGEKARGLKRSKLT